MNISRISTVLALLAWIGSCAAPVWAASGIRDEAATPIVRGTGRIVGKVSVTGDYRQPEPLKVLKNRAFCGRWVPNESLLVTPAGRLQNAVVILRPVSRSIKIQPARIVLDNKHCAFVPHVQVATVGSELLLKNSDPILHAVHARIGKETLFNVGLPTWRRVTKYVTRIGVIRIDCDVLHTWMSASIVVTDSPYFSVTDENGLFTIDHLPVGAYEIEIWHEKLGAKSDRISVSENTSLSLDVIYSFIERKP